MIALLVVVSSGYGFVNNGFETDYVYVSRDAAQGGQLRMYRESDGTQVADLLPDGSNWLSLTFAGTGANDAQLFVAKATAGDIEIARVNAAGQIQQSTYMSSLLGGPVGPSLDACCIRYSSLHNSLFVSTNTDTTQSTPAMAWEIDLGLSSLIHTYQGPTVPDRRVNIDIDPAGNLYMTSRHLGGSLNQGDLIAFDTVGRAVGGTTSVFDTLIDGSEYAAGDANYNQPSSPIFRGANNPSGRPTILLLANWDSSWVPELEFYLDERDANGNLVKRGEPISAKRGWNGQLDEVNGNIWFGSIRGGIMGLASDDTTTYWEGTRNWWDADSPAPEPATALLVLLGAVVLGLRPRS